HLVGEIHVPRRVDHVQLIALAVTRAVVERDALRLDRDPAFALQLHRVEHLRLHFAVGEAAAQLDEPVSEGRFAVVNVRDDGKVAYVPHGPPGCCRVLPRLKPCGRRIIGKFGPLSSAPGFRRAPLGPRAAAARARRDRGADDRPPRHRVTAPGRRARGGGAAAGPSRRRPPRAREARCCCRGLAAAPTSPRTVRSRGDARASGAAPPWRQRRRELTAAGSSAFSWLAMNRTVSGGTSPTAVILWPSITVEKADEE